MEHKNDSRHFLDNVSNDVHIAQSFRRFLFVLQTQFGLGRAEGGHVSGSALARRDMKVVGVHDLVGRGDDEHLRFPGRRLLAAVRQASMVAWTSRSRPRPTVGMISGG